MKLERLADGVKTAVPFVWLGLVLGLSFLEAPLKFQAPGVTLELGLGIGRLVFQALNRVELVLAAVLLTATFYAGGRRRRAAVVALGLLLLLLAAQTLWLLPALDARALLQIAGRPAPPSLHHWLYIGLEVLKLVLLAALGGFQLIAPTSAGTRLCRWR
jgi:hypothetical protein